MTWDERIATISINPDMASREDVANLASELMEARAEVKRLRPIVETMTKTLSGKTMSKIIEDNKRLREGIDQAIHFIYGLINYKMDDHLCIKTIQDYCKWWAITDKLRELLEGEGK
jgi:hypothetical protein